VQHRHLLPNEFDLLLDEESGFGVQPLRDHVRGCADCSARLAEAKALVAALDELPLMSPRLGMADRVMAHVPVFVPWHVAARDSVTRWLPTSPATRALAASLIAVFGSVLTGLTLWVATRGDVLAMFTGLLGEGVRNTASQAAGDLIVALFGPQLAAAVQQVGPLGVALAGGGFLIASFGTVFGLRLIATSSRARS
jgi:hypothetical protein